VCYMGCVHESWRPGRQGECKYNTPPADCPDRHYCSVCGDEYEPEDNEILCGRCRVLNLEDEIEELMDDLDAKQKEYRHLTGKNFVRQIKVWRG
jgi:hypothetical protein